MVQNAINGEICLRSVQKHIYVCSHISSQKHNIKMVQYKSDCRSVRYWNFIFHNFQRTCLILNIMSKSTVYSWSKLCMKLYYDLLSNFAFLWKNIFHYIRAPKMQMLVCVSYSLYPIYTHVKNCFFLLEALFCYIFSWKS